MRGLGLSAMLALWTLSPVLHLLQEAWEHLRPASAVASMRIEVKEQAPAICHHHPEGCPKDCFCPKIKPPEPSREMPAIQPGSFHEPTLVHCTQGDASHSGPGLIALALDGRPEWATPEVRTENPELRRILLPQSPCLDTPWKVPLV